MKTQRRMMIRLWIAALACGTAMACTAPLRAQDTPPAAPAGQQQDGGRRDPAEMEQRRLDMMTKQLSLTPDQVAQVKVILDTQRQETQAMRASVGSGGDPRQQMSDIRRATSAKIRGLLTDDQKQKFDEMESRMAQRQGARGQGAPPPSTPPAV